MKKDVVRQLNGLADALPIVLEWKDGEVEMKGWELMLTPLDEVYRFEKDKSYNIPVPMLVAVEHRIQLKDEYKRGGWQAVEAYYDRVIQKTESNQYHAVSN